LYQRCLRECQRTCEQNGVSADHCKCAHCLEILQ
jgi:hypothetical protein